MTSDSADNNVPLSEDWRKATTDVTCAGMVYAFLTSLSVGAALFKPNELPSVDIESLNHLVMDFAWH